MPICLDCSVDFLWLEDEVCVCNKCLELRDKSKIEKVSIRADSIPRIIFDLPGAAEQIGNFQTSDFTSDIWELAQGYKTNRFRHAFRPTPYTESEPAENACGVTSAASKLIKIKALDKARFRQCDWFTNAQEDLPIFDVIATRHMRKNLQRQQKFIGKAAAQAKARPGQAGPPSYGLAWDSEKPKPPKAGRSPGFQAEPRPEHHYLATIMRCCQSVREARESRIGEKAKLFNLKLLSGPPKQFGTWYLGHCSLFVDLCCPKRRSPKGLNTCPFHCKYTLKSHFSPFCTTLGILRSDLRVFNLIKWRHVKRLERVTRGNWDNGSDRDQKQVTVPEQLVVMVQYIGHVDGSAN
ncbi:hypothetical protein GGX14DRAFT_391603 [Mycena pura]|uniref:Uncharacterized protein n=1 Tax=Mycena pura TaxID=153505 RepID=A0AAD6YJM2_9AGAR|nr:hypothetical protein GGX14DRAFT_391603 [Mycena pura]